MISVDCFDTRKPPRIGKEKRKKRFYIGLVFIACRVSTQELSVNSNLKGNIYIEVTWLNVKLVKVPHKCKHESSWFMFGGIKHKLFALL